MTQDADLDFLKEFWERRVVTSYALFALNILIFILMSLAGGTTNSATQMAFGVKSNPAIDSGEIWRFVTPVFLHIGLLHLAFNSYALWIVGPQVEKLYGPARFLLLYLITGIAGVAASYWYHPFDVSAGASGAIFGLFGALLVFSYRYRKVVPEFFSQSISKGMLMTVGINLVIGYMIPQVDNSAHVGGLLTGGLLALVVPFQRPGERTSGGFKALEAALVGLVAVSFFMVAITYNGPALSLTNLTRSFQGGSGPSVGGFVYAINTSQQAFDQSEMALLADSAQGLTAARVELGRAIDILQDAPSLDRQADALTADLLEVVRKQYAYVQEVERTGKKGSDFIGASPQSRRYSQVRKAIDQWVESEGERFGLVNTK